MKNSKIAYKAFNDDWTCNDDENNENFKYQVGLSYYYTGGKIDFLKKGFQCYETVEAMFADYPFVNENINTKHNIFHYCAVEYCNEEKDTAFIHEDRIDSNMFTCKLRITTNYMKITKELTDKEIRSLSQWSKVWRNKHKQIHRDTLYKNGSIKPAIINYNNKGKISEKHWMKNGEFHNSLGNPAYEMYNTETGTPTIQCWFVDGKPIKIEGEEIDEKSKPHIVFYDRYGNIKTAIYNTQSGKELKQHYNLLSRVLRSGTL